MSETIQYTGELVVDTCWCGITHAIPESLYDRQQRDFRDGQKQTGIYCPLGHTYIRSGEGEAARLKRQLEAEQNRRAAVQAELDQTEASLRAQKGATTRAKRRHAAAVCPACNRSFKQLRAHMERMHPDYDPARDA